jgi:hypothetical protein
MPDVMAPTDAASYAIPVEDDPVNFMGFKTQVEGKPVAMQVEQRVLALGIDRTDLLKKLDVPLAPYLEAATKAVRALPDEQQAELLTFGILRSEEYDIGQGMKHYVSPNWTLRTTYYSSQVFPARKELVIEHQYQPSVGATAGTSIGASYADAATMESYRKSYCLDSEFIAAAARARKAIERKEGASLQERRLEYVLVTGSNWAGPIKDFRLVVDKGSPNNLVSFCGNKVKKISPTQFEVRASDYWPERNLEVLILEPTQ